MKKKSKSGSGKSGSGKRRTRVLVIGMDGATFDLIKPWVKQGFLPNFKKALSEGVSGRFTEPWLPITAPVWTSMLTGKNPGKHGVYDFSKVVQGYETVPVTADDADAEFLFESLTRAGKRSVVLNVPATYPARPANGVIVSGMPAPELNEKSVYPRALAAALRKRGYEILPEEVYENGNEEALVAGIDSMLRKQLDLALELEEREDWDFFFFVFFVTDIVGHWFWKHMDAAHPLHEAKHDEFKNVIRDFYVKADEGLGKLVAKAREKAARDGSELVVFIVSDHGMGALHKDVFINNWLHERGFLEFKRAPLTVFKRALHAAGFTLENAYSIAQKLGLARFTAGTGERSEKMRAFVLKHFFLSFADVDWARTRAYSATNFGPIFVNLKGRETHGIVEQRDYEKVRSEVIRELLAWREASGERVVERAIRKEEAVSGPHVGGQPDVFFWIKGMKYTTNRYFEFASNELFGKPHRGMSGDHRMDGIFIAFGDNVKRGARCDARVVDLAPTVLRLLGAPSPDGVDGAFLKSVFANPVKYREAWKSEAGSAAEKRAALREAIRKTAARIASLKNE